MKYTLTFFKSFSSLLSKWWLHSLPLLLWVGRGPWSTQSLLLWSALYHGLKSPSHTRSENVQIECNSDGRHWLSLRTGVLPLLGRLRVRGLFWCLQTPGSPDRHTLKGAGSFVAGRAGFSVGLHGTWLSQCKSLCAALHDAPALRVASSCPTSLPQAHQMRWERRQREGKLAVSLTSVKILTVLVVSCAMLDMSLNTRARAF